MRLVAIVNCANCPYGKIRLSNEMTETMVVRCILQNFNIVGQGHIVPNVHESCPLPGPQAWMDNYLVNRAAEGEAGAEEHEATIMRIRGAVAFGPHSCLKPGDLDKALPRRQKDDPVYKSLGT